MFKKKGVKIIEVTKNGEYIIEKDKLGTTYIILYKEENEEIWEGVEYYKDNITGTNNITYGALYFSFDKKTLYNYWRDYPNNLTKKEREIFKRERPYLADIKR